MVQHNLVYRDFKDLARRTASDKAFNFAKNSKYDRYERGLLKYSFLLCVIDNFSKNVWVVL